MKPLLITRPEPGLERSVKQAVGAGLNAISTPLFALQAIPWQLPSQPSPPFDCVLLGSANAVHQAGAGLPALRHLPVYAVGDKTAEAAQKAGMTITHIGSSNLAAAARQAAQDARRHAIRLTGRRHTELTALGSLTVTTIIAYEAAPLALSPEAVAALSTPCVVMAHSGQAVERAEAEMHRLDTSAAPHILLAISQRVASHARMDWGHIAVTRKPDDAEMLAQARILCQRKPQDGAVPAS